jgi:hypothetical protein
MPTSLEVGRVGGVMWVRVWLAGTSLAGRWLAGTLIAGSLGAYPVDNRYDTISRSLAKARNESIFLNIVRASHDYPLSFVVVSNVTPAMTNNTSLVLPSFLFGPSFAGSLPTAAGRDVVFGSTTAANSTAVSSISTCRPRRRAPSMKAFSSRSIFRPWTTSSVRAIRASYCSGCSPTRLS